MFYSVYLPLVLGKQQTGTCPERADGASEAGTGLPGREWAGGGTHQVDGAADVAVHERHEAVHQVAGREARPLSCPPGPAGAEHRARAAHLPEGNQNPRGRLDVK